MRTAADLTSSSPGRSVDHDLRRVAAVVATVVAALLVNVSVAVAAAKPSVRLSPSSGPPGTEVTVIGANWPPGHMIVASFPDRGFYIAGNATSAVDGSFRITFRWPDPASPGPHQLAVIDNTGPVDTPPYPVFTVTSGQAPTSASTASVDRAFTTGGSPTEKATFAPGDPVWYVVTIHVDGAPARGSVRWKVTGPRTLYDYTNGGVEVHTGYQAPYSPSKIPADAPEGDYTLTATVTLNGTTNVRTSTFTVRSPSPTSPDLVEAARAAVDAYNALCAKGWCGFAPPQLSEVLKIIGRVGVVVDIARVGHQLVVIGNDAKALNAALKGYVKGTPLTSEQRRLFDKLQADNRELINIIPGLDLVFPPPVY